MKYYRRHKHELNHVDGDDPLPAPPSKKMRYGKNDDILLAKHFVNKPDGTSDKVFQDFARIVSIPRAIYSSMEIEKNCRILTIHGKAGKNTTGFTRPKLTI